MKTLYNTYTTDDFILDPFFSKWVISPDNETEQFWSNFLKDHPEQAESIREATLIVRAIRAHQEPIPDQKLNHIYNRLVNEKKSSQATRFIQFARYAAAVLLIAAISATYIFIHKQDNFFPEEAVIPTVSDKGILITANGNKHEFTTENTCITQASPDKLTINNDTIISNKEEKKTKELPLNQVIIPYGKRSEITLSDGTHIWLNSGSQLSYPSEFKSNTREVYLSGEALFQVAENKEKPFYVITRDVKVRVLGTRFNVSAYHEDATVQTVLIQGKVSIAKNKAFASDVEMQAGERVSYLKQTESMEKDQVDTDLFSSWINGYLIFENEPTTEVFKKLERFYNRKITPEAGLEQITFSGKLDLKTDLTEVLENISFASSISYVETEDAFIIKL